MQFILSFNPELKYCKGHLIFGIGNSYLNAPLTINAAYIGKWDIFGGEMSHVAYDILKNIYVQYAVIFNMSWVLVCLH